MSNSEGCFTVLVILAVMLSSIFVAFLSIVVCIDQRVDIKILEDELHSLTSITVLSSSSLDTCEVGTKLSEAMSTSTLEVIKHPYLWEN
jgi:hypothetical protein